MSLRETLGDYHLQLQGSVPVPRGTHPSTTATTTTTCCFLTTDHSYPSLSPISDMSQPSSSSSFQALFGAALQDYENRTGISLVSHPLAKQLEECDSLDSTIAILREQAKGFREVREDNGKLMKSVKCSVDVLYILSISTVLGEGVGLVRPNSHRHDLLLIVVPQPFPPAKAIFAGIAILLAVWLFLHS